MSHDSRISNRGVDIVSRERMAALFPVDDDDDEEEQQIVASKLPSSTRQGVNNKARRRGKQGSVAGIDVTSIFPVSPGGEGGEEVDGDETSRVGTVVQPPAPSAASAAGQKDARSQRLQSSSSNNMSRGAGRSAASGANLDTMGLTGGGARFRVRPPPCSTAVHDDVETARSARALSVISAANGASPAQSQRYFEVSFVARVRSADWICSWTSF